MGTTAAHSIILLYSAPTRALPPSAHTGIIIAATIIVAAGIAVYESPQVREFVNKGRRRIAIALHTLGEEIHPNARRPSSGSNGNGPEAEELRRLQRAELVERNRDQFLRQRDAEIAEREKNKRAPESGYASFDDFLSQDAEKTGTYTIRNTSVTHPDEEGLRRRPEGARGLERGGAFANPFADPIGEEEASQVLFDATLMGASQESLHNEKVDDGATPQTRETTAKLPAEPDNEALNQTADKQAALLDLSTSNAATTASSPDSPAKPFQPSTYWSVVHEWAENTPPPHYQANASTPGQQQGENQEPQTQQHLDVPNNNDTATTASSTPSLVGSGEEIHSHDGSIDVDVMSDAGGVSSVGSWTEVGSEVSEGDHGDQGVH